MVISLRGADMAAVLSEARARVLATCSHCSIYGLEVWADDAAARDTGVTVKFDSIAEAREFFASVTGAAPRGPVDRFAPVLRSVPVVAVA